MDIAASVGPGKLWKRTRHEGLDETRRAARSKLGCGPMIGSIKQCRASRLGTECPHVWNDLHSHWKLTILAVWLYVAVVGQQH